MKTLRALLGAARPITQQAAASLQAEVWNWSIARMVFR